MGESKDSFGKHFLQHLTDLHPGAGVSLGNVCLPHETPASVQLQAVRGHLVLQLRRPVFCHRRKLVPAFAHLGRIDYELSSSKLILLRFFFFFLLCLAWFGRELHWQPDGVPCTGRWRLLPQQCSSSLQPACAETEKTSTTTHNAWKPKLQPINLDI